MLCSVSSFSSIWPFQMTHSISSTLQIPHLHHNILNPDLASRGLDQPFPCLFAVAKDHFLRQHLRQRHSLYHNTASLFFFLTTFRWLLVTVKVLHVPVSTFLSRFCIYNVIDTAELFTVPEFAPFNFQVNIFRCSLSLPFRLREDQQTTSVRCIITCLTLVAW